MILRILEQLRTKKLRRTSRTRELQTVYSLRKTTENNPENPIIRLQATGKDLIDFMFHEFQNKNALAYSPLRGSHHFSRLITSRNYDTSNLTTRFQALQAFKRKAIIAIRKMKFKTKEHVETLKAKTEELKLALLEVLANK